MPCMRYVLGRGVEDEAVASRTERIERATEDAERHRLRIEGHARIERRASVVLRRRRDARVEELLLSRTVAVDEIAWRDERSGRPRGIGKSLLDLAARQRRGRRRRDAVLHERAGDGERTVAARAARIDDRDLVGPCRTDRGNEERRPHGDPRNDVARSARAAVARHRTALQQRSCHP